MEQSYAPCVNEIAMWHSSTAAVTCILCAFDTISAHLTSRVGKNYTLFLRDDISNMEVAAKKFEKENGILEEIRQQANIGDDLYSYPLSMKFNSVPEDGYTPYCGKSFDFNSETPARTQECLQEFSESKNKYGIGNFRPEFSEASISYAASTLCSSGEPVESFSTFDNVQADSNVGKLDSKRLFKEGLHCKHGSSVSSLSHHEFLRTQQSNLVHGLEAKPSVDEQSDDSDLEIFRVKRRSSLKVEKRFVNDASSSKNYEHQGLKRLKKFRSEGRYGQTTSSEGFRTDESNRSSTSGSDYKEAPESASKDRVDPFQHALGKTTRKPAPIEIGPKRLKVRGPSFLGSGSRPRIGALCTDVDDS
ncbi:hypothetical protein OIU84_022512 [Salix udensis]|uniref:Uncharacterized protein n=1 Tax=Salix udensis TaxID=889485 RepID=A0AAD6KQ63_9ROSI|nr:hypothetical protein OIU84_022512 [Salix udensis]